jgi:hypothetical protein
MIENVALMALLMLCGVGLTWVVLWGFFYYLEFQDE